MYENIYEALEAWNWANFEDDDEGCQEAAEAIYAFKEQYRKTGEVVPKAKVVGVFSETKCLLYVGDVRIGTLFGLKYSGHGSNVDDTRLYMNDDSYIWLDYAVYE